MAQELEKPEDPREDKDGAALVVASCQQLSQQMGGIGCEQKLAASSLVLSSSPKNHPVTHPKWKHT